MRRLILFFSLLTLSLGCASSGPSFLSHAFEDDIQESRKLIEAGNFKQAADDLSVFLEMAPKNDEARFLRALAYQNLEQFPAAIKDYETIIKNIRKNNQKTLSDHTAKSHYNLGMIFAFKLNEPHQALEHFDDYLSLSQASHDSNERDYQVAKIMCSLDHSDSSEKNEDLPTLMIEVGKIQNTLEKRKRLEEILKLLAAVHLIHQSSLFLKANSSCKRRHFYQFVTKGISSLKANFVDSRRNVDF